MASRSDSGAAPLDMASDQVYSPEPDPAVLVTVVEPSEQEALDAAQADRSMTSSGGGDDSLVFSSSDSVVFRPDRDTFRPDRDTEPSTLGDSSFEAIKGLSSGKDDESSFEQVDLGHVQENSPRDLDQQTDDDDYDAPEKLLGKLTLHHKTDEHDAGLLNPEAPTFELATGTDEQLALTMFRNFNDVVELGKDEIGHITPLARIAMGKMGLKSIPAMHGPLGLPYARCPSGIDAFLLSASHTEDDPFPFVYDPTAPPRPTTLAIPLPGNARYTRNPGRTAPRAVSGPAALETYRSRPRGLSNPPTHKSIATPALVMAASRRKPTPTTAPAPHKTASLAVQSQNYVSSQQAMQQQHRAMPHPLEHASHPSQAVPTAYAQPQSATSSEQSQTTVYPTATALQQMYSPPLQAYSPHYLYNQFGQPYGLVPSAQSAQAALASSILQTQVAIQSRRNSLAALGLGLPPAGPSPTDVNSLMAMQLAAQQQQQHLADVAAASRSTSYETAPADVSDFTDDEPEAVPHRSVADDKYAAQFYQTAVSALHSDLRDPNSIPPPATFNPGCRRKSAAPAFPHPGAPRKPSVQSSVDVGPRRASIAPATKLGKEQQPIATATFPARPAQSRKTSYRAVPSTALPPITAYSSHAPPPSRRSSVAVAPALSASVPPSASYGKAKPGSAAPKQRVFGDVGNTVASGTSAGTGAAYRPPGGASGGGGRKSGKDRRHASETDEYWRHFQQQQQQAQQHGQSDVQVPVVAVEANENDEPWAQVVDSVAEALVSPDQHQQHQQKYDQRLLGLGLPAQGRRHLHSSPSSSAGSTTPTVTAPTTPQPSELGAGERNAAGEGEKAREGKKGRGGGRSRRPHRGKGKSRDGGLASGQPGVLGQAAPVVTASAGGGHGSW
ncbi:hypothetical protein JCM8097_008289 [Rhodosporidiobolus ruineniae]